MQKICVFHREVSILSFVFIYTCILPITTFDTIITINEMSETRVHETICNLHKREGSGPDRIPSIFVKSWPSLEKPLCFLFNKCISTGVFNKKMESPAKNPAHKSVDTIDVTDYRPISLLNQFAKISEILIIFPS